MTASGAASQDIRLLFELQKFDGPSAISYIQIKLADGKVRWGAAVDTNIELASIKAVLSALNRA